MGCQILNVELGGTLHQHLPDVVGHLAHRSAPYVFGDVEVETVAGSVAAGVFGDAPTVLCSHHQAIRDLGRGLVPTAATADGVVEAVELPSARFVLGVQWHPEEAMDQRPFDALVGRRPPTAANGRCAGARDGVRLGAAEQRGDAQPLQAEHVAIGRGDPDQIVSGSPGKVCAMAKSGARKVVKPVAAAAVTLGTIASIWWFALKPRRKAKQGGSTATKE